MRISRIVPLLVLENMILCSMVMLGILNSSDLETDETSFKNFTGKDFCWYMFVFLINLWF